MVAAEADGRLPDDYVQQQKLINAVEVCGDKIFDYVGRHERPSELLTSTPSPKKEKTTKK